MHLLVKFLTQKHVKSRNVKLKAMIIFTFYCIQDTMNLLYVSDLLNLCFWLYLWDWHTQQTT